MTWHSIVTQADADALLQRFGAFHDGCLREVHLWTGHWVSSELSMACDSTTSARVLFQRQVAPLSAIELEFRGITRLNVAPAPPSYTQILAEAAVCVHAGVIYWAEDSRWTPDAPDRDDSTWIGAREVRWRDASEWMGESLRYGPPAR
jgi:hypothetical protein